MMDEGENFAPVIIGMGFIIFLSLLATIIVFLLLVDPPNRSHAFYAWLSLACGAELTIFAWSSIWLIERDFDTKITGAAKIIIHVMITMWLLLTLIVALTVTVVPKGRYQDYIAIFYIALTILFLIGASVLFNRDLRLKSSTAATQAERLQMRGMAFHLEIAKQALGGVAALYQQEAIPFDRFCKRLEGISTSLEYAPPAREGTREVAGRSSMHMTSAITSELNGLHQYILSLDGQDLDIARVRAELDTRLTELENLLAQRQRYLLS